MPIEIPCQKRLALLLPALFLLILGCSLFQPVSEQTTAPGAGGLTKVPSIVTPSPILPETQAASTPTGLEAPTAAAGTLPPTQTAPVQEATDTRPMGPWIACNVNVCGGPLLWSASFGDPRLVPMPFQPEYPYDLSESTGRLLYGSRFPDHGAGPGNISVTDLWELNPSTGETHALIKDEKIAKAVWDPSGKNLAYAAAEEDTYTLHYLAESGEDRLLAKDVAFTFGFTPAGDAIVFSRESRYKIEVEPGLYLVNIASGQEKKLSSFDREGYGSSADLPVFSQDGKYFLMHANTPNVGNVLMLVATDGSHESKLKLASPVEELVSGRDMGSYFLWHPDGKHLVGMVNPGQVENNPPQLVLYTLNPAMDSLFSAEVLLQGDIQLVSWDQPGSAVWVKDRDNQLSSVPLP